MGLLSNVFMAILAGASLAAAQTPPPLEFLFSANVTVGQQRVLGPGPSGTRVVIPVTGGTFAGPKLSGRATLL